MSISPIQWLLWASGLALQSLVLSALIRAGWRRYPFLFLFISVLALTTVTDIYMYLTVRSSDVWMAYYWSAEVARQTAVFLLVAGFAVQATPSDATVTNMKLLAGCAAALYWAGSLAFTRDPQMNLWMTRFVRNLSFGAAVVNLGVWFYLISSSRRKLTTLVLAGALGIQMTGEAMGQSLRQMLPQQYAIGNAVSVLGHFACMAIWWRALVREQKPSTPKVL